MKKININSTNLKPNQKGDKFPDLPHYPESEDIYNKFKEETEINPEDISQKKEIAGDFPFNVKDFEDDVSGSDLDVPGSELDDKMENIGSEDEENNYYSIGGDDHNDLEEDGTGDGPKEKMIDRKK